MSTNVHLLGADSTLRVVRAALNSAYHNPPIGKREKHSVCALSRKEIVGLLPVRGPRTQNVMRLGETGDTNSNLAWLLTSREAPFVTEIAVWMRALLMKEIGSSGSFRGQEYVRSHVAKPSHSRPP